MDRKINEEMGELSKIVFKSASKWRKILEKGVPVPEFVTKLVPNLETRQIEEVQFKTGKYTLYRYSLEELKTIMLSMKA